jgi:hypothetical protein
LHSDAEAARRRPRSVRDIVVEQHVIPGERAMYNNNGLTTFRLVALGVLLVVGAGVGIHQLIQMQTVAPFEQHLAEYTAQPSVPDGGFPTTYVKGKVVPVEFHNGKQKIDYIYFDLPAELKAEKPEDVKTVVWLEYDEDKIDEFDDGAAAYVWTVKVSVIDKERGRMVGQQDFRGGDPPMTKTYSGAAYGPRPNKEVVDYLMSLPRQ